MYAMCCAELGIGIYIVIIYMGFNDQFTNVMFVLRADECKIAGMLRMCFGPLNKIDNGQ